MAQGPLIAIFCNSFPPEGGGASNRIYNLAVLLREAGYRVQVVCAMPNYPFGKIFPDYRKGWRQDEELAGIAVRRVWLSPSNSASAPARSWSMASFMLSLRMQAYRHILRQRPALVIVSSPPLPMAAATVRFFKKKGLKVLLNVSDIWPLSAHALGALGPSYLYHQLERMAARMYGRADALTTQSEETRAHIAAQLPQMPPTMVYRNLPAPHACPTSLPAAPGAPLLRVVYPGMLGHAQGLLELCRAIDFGALGACLDIYGAGPEQEQIQAFLSANPQRGITLFQPVPPPQLAEKLGQAHAVLIPLIAPINGALPSKLFTAMHAGKPVVYSGGGEGEQIVRDYDLGLIAPPGDYATISEQIRSLAARRPEALQAWEHRIRATAAQHFSKEAQDAQWLRFIAQLIATAP